MPYQMHIRRGSFFVKINTFETTKISNGVNVFSFSIENVLKKYGKCFLKMCGNPDYSVRMRSSGEKNSLLISVNQNVFSRFYTLTPVWISNIVGCFCSGSQPTAIHSLQKTTWI